MDGDRACRLQPLIGDLSACLVASGCAPVIPPAAFVLQDIGQAVCEKLFTSGAAPVASCLVEEKKGGLGGRELFGPGLLEWVC